jgi:hypothetical protein
MEQVFQSKGIYAVPGREIIIWRLVRFAYWINDFFKPISQLQPDLWTEFSEEDIFHEATTTAR